MAAPEIIQILNYQIKLNMEGKRMPARKLCERSLAAKAIQILNGRRIAEILTPSILNMTMPLMTNVKHSVQFTMISAVLSVIVL